MKSADTPFSAEIRAPEAGNALIYVLIAIALFAALSFSLARQTDTSETGTLSGEKAELYATQIIDYTAQAKSAVEQMEFSGTSLDEIDLVLPGEAGYDTAPHIHKLFHPEGGGLINRALPKGVWADDNTVTPAGWYFKKLQVAWSPTAQTDLVLSAYRISRPVCEAIMKKILRGAAIPAGATSMYDMFADKTVVSTLNTAYCADCENYPGYCVHGGAGQTNLTTYYSILSAR